MAVSNEDVSEVAIVTRDNTAGAEGRGGKGLEAGVLGG